MAQELIAHKCMLCGSVYKTRKRAKEHVECSHSERVKPMFGPGQHIDYIWWDLRK